MSQERAGSREKGIITKLDLHILRYDTLGGGCRAPGGLLEKISLQTHSVHIPLMASADGIRLGAKSAM